MNRAAYFYVFIFFSGMCLNMSAQDISTFIVRGVLVDSIEMQPLDAAHVFINRARDSVYVTGAMSNQRGIFEIENLPAGQYLLVVSYLGFEPLFRPFTLSGAARDVNLGVITLNRQDMVLDEVVVTARFNPIIIRGDTIEYNTDAYRIQDSDVVEDLLRRLPGVEVNQDGTVTVGGQQITRVYVDGRQFFGDDPRVALRNLPANVVDRVQVVDRRSDQAQFTGIEDDNTERILNLTLRPGNRDGTFGRALAGWGADIPKGVNELNHRYDANGLLAYFSGNTQVAALISSNNTNNINFTDFMGEVMGAFGGGGMRMGGGGMGGGQMMMVMPGGMGGGGGRMGSAGGAGQRMMGMGGLFGMAAGGAGITTSTSGGANANFILNEKLRLDANYFFNIVNRDSEQNSNRINFLADNNILNYDQWQRQNRESQNHRFNFELDYSINERNSILFRPNLNIGGGSTNSLYNYETFTPEIPMLGSGETVSSSENTSLSTSGSLLWRHRFERPGRTFSLNLTYGWSMNEASGSNLQLNRTLNRITSEMEEEEVNQIFTNDNHGFNYSARASYVEPVGDNRFLEFSYSYSRSHTESERRTYDFNETSESHDIFNQGLSTLFENTFINQQADIRFNTRRDRYNYTLGVGIHPTTIISKEGANPRVPLRSGVNFAPSINIVYGQSRQSQLRFDYRGMTQQPTIQQLQPVADNSDPLYEFVGNKSLKPAFRHHTTLQYNNFNPTNFRTFMTMLGFTTVRNSIVNSSTFDPSGKQTVTPDNVNGVYNINGSVMMNLPIPNTRLSVSNTVMANFGNSVSKTEGVVRNTRNSGISETFRLTFRNEWLELGTSYMLRYNRANYLLQDQATINYFNHRVGGEMFLNLPFDFIITSNINYNFFRGYDDDFDRDMTMWTADLSKRVFKNKQGTIKLSVYDILRQNNNFSRTTTDNYVEDLRSNTLGRFAMLSFSYRFNSFGGGQQGGGGGQMMRMPGGPTQGGGPPMMREGGAGGGMQMRIMEPVRPN